MGMLKIEYERGTWEFEPGQEITIGRHSDCTIVVSDPTVSRRHLIVHFDGQTWTLTNTGSTGTYEHGRMVETLVLDTSATLHLGSQDGTPIRFQPEQVQPAAQSVGPDQSITVTLDGTEATFVPGQLVTVGRDSNSTFVITEPSVSRQHLSIEHNGREWVATDTSSSGTYAAGERITALAITSPITLTLGAVDGYHLGLWVLTAAPAGGLPGGGHLAGSTDELVSSSTHTEFRPLQQQVEARQLTSPPLWLLIPFGAWVKSKRIRAGLPLFLILVWVAPIVIDAAFNNVGIIDNNNAWAWSIYFGLLWAVLLWGLIRPGMIPVPAMIVVVAAEALLLKGTDVVQRLNQPLDASKFGDALQIGVHEEVAKALAVILVVVIYEFFLHAPRLSVRGYMYLGALSGVTFGTIECNTYLQQYYNLAAACIQNPSKAGVSNPIGCLSVVNPDQVLFRAITDGFTHALWASIAGFFIGLAVLHRRWAVQFILLGLAIPILFHAANDFFLGHNSPWVTAGLVGVAALMTVGYAISGNQIDRIIGQIESASARLPSASRSRYQQSPR
jgi:pSer/pThr/pTyr-binding forkhead associated (FHA) protein/RsiW-degrading membrane proteinase PrsW (M82 family)